MRTGIYETREGERVHVERTATGYKIRRADGSVTMIGGAK